MNFQTIFLITVHTGPHFGFFNTQYTERILNKIEKVYMPKQPSYLSCGFYGLQSRISKIYESVPMKLAFSPYEGLIESFFNST